MDGASGTNHSAFRTPARSGTFDQLQQERILPGKTSSSQGSGANHSTFRTPRDSGANHSAFRTPARSGTFDKLLSTDGVQVKQKLSGDGGLNEKRDSVRSSGRSKVTKISSEEHESNISAKERHRMLRYGTSMETEFSVENDLKPWIRHVYMSPKFETFGGFVVLCNFLVMSIETNARASPEDEVTLRMTEIMNRIFLGYYTCECIIRLCTFGRSFFVFGWNNLDLVIVCTGLLGEILEITTGSQASEGLENVAMLKSMRMLRLIRLLRLLVAFRELYVLIAGLSRCMKTLLWSCGLIFLSLNVWSIISVEYLQKYVLQLTAEGYYDNCTRCQVAFSNIWRANITWFAVVTGDGWSELFWPLIERYYWPFAVLAANIFIVCYGLMNLIVAAIVESSAQAREEDIKSAAKMHRLQQNSTWGTFQELCKELDSDGNGEISVEEFITELQQNRELQNMLLVMGVEEREVAGLFEIMDINGDGVLQAHEFVEQFYEMRTHVVKTSLFYVLKYCQSLMNMQQRQWKYLQELQHWKYLQDLQHVQVEPWHKAKSDTPAHDKEVNCSMSSDSGACIVNALGSDVDSVSSLLPRASGAVLGSNGFTQPVSELPGWYYYGISPPIGVQCSEGGARKRRGLKSELQFSLHSVHNADPLTDGPPNSCDGNDKAVVVEPVGTRTTVL